MRMLRGHFFSFLALLICTFASLDVVRAGEVAQAVLAEAQQAIKSKQESMAAQNVAVAQKGMAVQDMNTPQEISILPLLKEKVCMSCHLIDKKRVGPSLLMIAERYAEQGEDFIPVLAERIITGGKGHWGPLIMPAQNKVSQEEAQIMARWILSLKPKLHSQ